MPTPWTRSGGDCWAICTTFAPSGIAATCPATTVGSRRCRPRSSRTIRRPKNCVKKLKTWQKELDKADGRDIDLWQSRVDQVKAQIADKTVEAEKYGYQSHQIKDASGKVVYDAPAIEELIRWRLWDRTGAGLMAELGSHQLDAASLFVAAAHGGEKQHPLTVVGGGRPAAVPARPRRGRSRLLHPGISRARIRCERSLGKPQENRRAIRLDQRQRFRRIRRDRLRHQADADPGARKGIEHRSRSGGRRQSFDFPPAKPAALDTQASGPVDVAAAKAAADADAQSRVTPKKSSTGHGASAIPLRKISRAAIRRWPWATP